MKIRKILIISLALIICLTGCAKQKINSAESENLSSVGETVTEQSSIETDESGNVTKMETTASAVSNAPTDNTSATFKSTENSTKQSTQAEEKTSYVPPKESSTQRHKPVESTRPSISTTQPTTNSAQPTKPVTSPSTTVPSVQEFDIDYWIRYAKSYAQSVGLRLDSTATDCWDNPISANPKRKNLEQDIQSRLNRYARDTDITNVWIWAEKISDNSYEIYIGYA